MDKNYYEYVEHSKKLFDNYKEIKRKVEYYPIYFHYEDDDIWFRFEFNLIYFHTSNMTLKDIEQKLIEDFPFIKSIQFYNEIYYDEGIII